MSTVLRILHAASHEINVGDGALIQSMQRTVRELVPGRAVSFRDLDVVLFEKAFGARPLDPGDLAGADLVLVGGGGAIDGKPSRTASGMVFPLAPGELARLPTPLAYVALGHNLFPGERFHCRERLAELLRVCRDKDVPVSVRNDGSLERLREDLGTDADPVVEIPDPGFFVKVDESFPHPQMTGDGPLVILQPAGDDPARRLPGPGAFRFRRRDHALGDFAAAMARIAVWLTEEFGARVVFAPHIVRDLEMTAAIISRLPPRVARYRTGVLGIFHPRDAGRYFAAYRSAHLVVGMRGHSAVCAVGLGVPCVAVSTHAKVEGFMGKCGLGDWVAHPGRDMEERLRELCRRALEDPGAYRRIRDAGTAGFADRFRGFMRRCLDLVG